MYDEVNLFVSNDTNNHPDIDTEIKSVGKDTQKIIKGENTHVGKSTGAFGDPNIIYQPEKIAVEMDRLTLARNIGPKPLKEIALLLYDFYFIDDVQKWLES